MGTSLENPSEDLPEATRSASQADLSAGSAGYQHFLQQLANYLSPNEALLTQKQFRAARRVFWLITATFLVAYLAFNQILGPHGVQPAAWANDALRAVLLLAATVLITRFRLGVAGQLLLPLASLCFLPLPLAEEKNWSQGPAIFGMILLTLFLAGWCLDAAGRSQPLLASFQRWLPRLGILLLALLNLAGWLWIQGQAVPPLLSFAACVFALILLERARPPAQNPSDVEFLYAASWKRWRFFLSGRALAIILGIVPFLLFANLLDYQEQLERAADVEKAPEVLRIHHEYHEWKAYFWRQEGRFLTTTDFEPFKKGDRVLRAFYLIMPTFPTAPIRRNSPKFAADPSTPSCFRRTLTRSRSVRRSWPSTATA